MNEQPPLVKIPAQPELQWPALQILGAKDSTWLKKTWTSHHACDICTLVVHERGVQGAPAPFPATMRRKGPGGGIVPADAYLCSRHGQALQERDEKVKTTWAAKGAHAAHMARRTR